MVNEVAVFVCNYLWNVFQLLKCVYYWIFATYWAYTLKLYIIVWFGTWISLCIIIWFGTCSKFQIFCDLLRKLINCFVINNKLAKLHYNYTFTGLSYKTKLIVQQWQISSTNIHYNTDSRDIHTTNTSAFKNVIIKHVIYHPNSLIVLALNNLGMYPW